VSLTRHYVDGPFGQLHLVDAGPQVQSGASAQPLVCFHQSPQSSVQFALFQTVMSADRRVICMDTPGFGGSDAPSSVPTIEHYAEALAIGLKALGFGEGRLVDVLGFHTGTQICVELAASRPDLVRRVVLSSLALFTEEELKRNRAGFGGPRPLFSDPGYVGRYFRQQVSEGLDGMSMERRLALFAERLRPGSLSWYGPEAVFAYETEQRLRKVTQPTLLYVMCDTLSENTRRAALIIERATVQERMDIHGPAGWDIHPEQIAADVRHFLDAAQ